MGHLFLITKTNSENSCSIIYEQKQYRVLLYNNLNTQTAFLFQQKKNRKKKLTIEVTAQLSLFFPGLVEAVCFQLLPVELIFFLDLQVAVQLRLTHRQRRHLWEDRQV